MTSTPPGEDPLVSALDDLVRSGALTPERAQAAYDAGRRDSPAAQTPATAAPEQQAAAPRLDVIATVLGLGLVLATIGLSATYARAESDLDWSSYSLGLLGTVGLLGIAAGGRFLVSDHAKRDNLAAWPGALGVASVGVMAGIALDDSDATGYIVGLLVAGLSAAGYLFLVRRGAYVVVGILGLLATYSTLVDDVFGLQGGSGDNSGMQVALAIVVFAILITVGGWWLPERDLGGVFVGWLTLGGVVAVLVGVMFAAMISAMTAGFTDNQPDPNRYDNDVYVVLGLGVLLTAGWLVCSWLSGHTGYRLLALATPVSVVTLATLALNVEHPSWWGLALGVIGGAVLLLAGLRGLGKFSNLGRR